MTFDKDVWRRELLGRREWWRSWWLIVGGCVMEMSNEIKTYDPVAGRAYLCAVAQRVTVGAVARTIGKSPRQVRNYMNGTTPLPYSVWFVLTKSPMGV